MSDYFSSLIDRHLGVMDIIKPRSSGRFEANQSVVDHDGARTMGVSDFEYETRIPASTASDAYTDTDNKPGSIENSHHMQSGPQADRYTPVVKPESKNDSLNQPDHLDSSMGKQITRESRPGISSIQDIDESLQLDAGRAKVDNLDVVQTRKGEPTAAENPAMDESGRSAPDANPSALEYGLDQRIGQLLQRLDRDFRISNKQAAVDIDTDRSSGRSPVKSPDVTLRSDINKRSPDAIQETGPFDTNVTEHRSGPEYNHQQTPFWLDEVRSRLGKIQQDQESSAEPVVNVTIGRIEVRAVNADKKRQSPDRKRPTGVMSLNDYLKRRDRGGRS